MARHSKIKTVALMGIFGNIGLLGIKLSAGLYTGSQAMIADGLNSAGDVFASVMTYIGNAIASRPDDDDHPYGHGKAEYLFSMIISFSLLLVAYTIFRSSLSSFINKEVYRFSIWLVIVAVTTIVTKVIFYIYATKVGKKYNSILAMANAEDHRNDVFVTSLTLFSVMTGYFNLYFIDAIAGMLIAMWIAYTGINIFTTSYNVLMDTTLDDSIKEDLKCAVESIDGVDHLDALVSKPVGLNYLLIVKISIDGNLTVAQGHGIGNKVKALLMDYELVDDVVVHLNPAQYHPQKDYLK
jgi:cation diffusion facilitator family transporter